MSYLCNVKQKQQQTMETNSNSKNEKSTWDEYWANSISEYYATHSYTGD